MKPPIIVGIVIAVVIGAGALFGPALRSSAGKEAAQALREAELARRLLSDAGARLANVTIAHEMASLDNADLPSLVAASSESLAALADGSREAVRKAAATDQKHAGAGIGPGSLRPIDVGVDGVGKAIGGFKARMAKDLALLASAEQAAKEAGVHGADLMAVKQITGMVHYLRASIAMAESIRFRRLLVAERDAMLKMGAALMFAQSNVDQYRGLDVTEIVAGLEKSRDSAEAAANEAKTETEALDTAVAQRERELQDVSSRLAAVRGELLAHEQAGFTAGDDASFGPYRRKHLELDQKLRDQQEEEQVLQFGGMRNAEFDSDDSLTASMTGGEPVVALSELKWRRADAERRADGYAAARESAERNIEQLRAIGEAAGGKQADYESRIKKLQEQFKAVLERQKSLLASAFEKENEALVAARSARQAFAAADRAAAKWVQDASAQRSELDPEGLNKRLKDISSDTFVKRIGSSDEGAALMLIARLDAQRIDDFGRELDARQQFAAFVPGVDFGSTETIDGIIKTAREDGTNALKDAISIFEKLARGAGTTEWVPKTALAAAQYLLSKIDTPNADQHFSDALASIEEAVAGQEHSPYLAVHVRFRNHLKAIAARTSEPAINTGAFGEDD